MPTRCNAAANLLVLSLTFFCHMALNAREIKGTVVSETDSTSIIGATCRLTADGRQIAAAVSDIDGAFSLATDTTGALMLEVGMTGYTQTEILIEDGRKNIDLGRVYLSEAIALNEITVKSKSMIDAKGRMVVYPSASDLRASSSAISLFQKLPLAGLDANPITRSLTVDGGSPMILINGVPSSVDDFNALQPKDIERIEYSRITPARYADRGVSGLINITLKKRNDGGSFYGWMRSATATAFVDANVKVSYHQGPSRFSFSYNPSWRNYQKVYDNISESYNGNDFRVDLEEHDRNPFNYFSNPLKLKYDYSPSIRTLFSATLSTFISTNKLRLLGHTIDSQLGEYDNYNLTTGKELTPVLDLFVRHDFNAKNSLEAQVVGTLGSEDYSRNNNYVFDDGTTQNYDMDVENRRRSLISEISYIHNFSDKTSLSAGYQNTVSHSRNKYLTSDHRPVLTENNNYVYARLGQQVGKIYLSFSTGAKLFWIKNDLNKRHFIRNLTSVQGSWNIGNKWNLTAAFQYSPSIPSLSSLTDYPQQTTPYLVSNGNPDLKVAENFVYQVMPSYQYKKIYAALLLTHRDIKNSVINDMIYLGDRKFLSQSVNSLKRRSYSGDIYLKISDIAGFGMSLNAGLSHYYSAGEGWSHHLTSFSGSMSLWWNKGPYTISYWRKLPGKYLSGHYVGKNENYDSLSFEYKPNQHWNVGVSWMYMFESKGTKYPSWSYSETNPSFRERFIRNNGNMIVLSVSYSADFGSIFRTAGRNLNNSDSGSSLLKM